VSPSDRPLLAFFGHHKCASTWIHNVVDAVAADAGWRIAYVYDEKLFDQDLAGYVQRERLDFLSYVNADFAHVAQLPRVRGFHVVRDPRDLVVSAYFSHKQSHPTHAWPELVPHRERLQKLSKRDGLLAEMDFSARFLEQMSTWDYGQENVLELKQEEFTSDPYGGFIRAFRFLGALDEEHYAKKDWPRYLARATANILWRWSRRSSPLRWPMPRIPGERLLGIVFDQRFEKHAAGREKGKEDSASHYRKGVGGDWVHHFEEIHVERFKERWNGLLLRLGYEHDADWQGERSARPALT
jgi:hypothetical protein